MSVFSPTLDTQIGFEQPVQAPRAYNPLGDVADLASNFLKANAKTASQGSVESSAIAGFNREIERLKDMKEQGVSAGKIKVEADKALIALKGVGLKAIPDYVQADYQAVTGVSFEASSYDSEEDFIKQQTLSSELGRSLRLGVKAQNPSFTNEEVESEVIRRISETALHEQSVQLENAKASAGLPVNSTPIVQAIQNDFNTLATKIAEFQADGIITREEFLSASTSVRALVSTKYANFNNNLEVKSVQDQMFGLIDDIGKGVSVDPIDVQLDAVQIALQTSGFNPATIGTVRSLIKTNPEKFEQIIRDKLDPKGEKGKTFVDALVEVWDAKSPEMKLENIFNSPPNTTPTQTGGNPALFDIPKVQENPDAYQKAVSGFSQVAAAASPKAVRENEAVRNSWLNTMNVTSSLIASQSDSFLLGDKLLNQYIPASMVPILEAIYQTDDINAAQTNNAIQEALSSERIRQENLLNSKLANTDTPEGQNLVIDPETGVLTLNVTTFEKRFKNVPQGDRRIKELRDVNKRIQDVGGLEAFFNLTDKRRSEILGGSNLERVFLSNMGEVFRLSKNLKLIDKKLSGLQALEEKYPQATQSFRDSQIKEGVSEVISQVIIEQTQEIVVDSASKLGSQTNPHQVATQEEVLALPRGDHFVYTGDGGTDSTGNLIVFKR